MSSSRVRSRHQRCSVRRRVLRNFAKFTGKHLCQSFFFNKVAGLSHRCFPVNFVKFLRTSFYRTPLGDCFWWVFGCCGTHTFFIRRVLQCNIFSFTIYLKAFIFFEGSKYDSWVHESVCCLSHLSKTEYLRNHDLAAKSCTDSFMCNWNQYSVHNCFFWYFQGYYAIYDKIFGTKQRN